MKKIYLMCLSILMLSFLTLAAYAQKNVTGTVRDGSGAVSGVSVSVKGTSRATSTDAMGQFAIEANNNDVLVFSAIGYVRQEISVGDRTTINVTFVEDNLTLEAVTIEGALGIQKDNKKLGYAVTTVKGEDLTRTNTVNPITALQGKVAGVNINVTGAAGVQSSPNIQIRGAKVLGNTPGQANNQPI